MHLKKRNIVLLVIVFLLFLFNMMIMFGGGCLPEEVQLGCRGPGATKILGAEINLGAAKGHINILIISFVVAALGFLIAKIRKVNLENNFNISITVFSVIYIISSVLFILMFGFTVY